MAIVSRSVLSDVLGVSLPMFKSKVSMGKRIFKRFAQSMVNTANDSVKVASDKEGKVQVIRWIIRAFTNRQPE